MEFEIRLILTRAPGESDPEYQKHLGEFYGALQDAGIEASREVLFKELASGVAGFQTLTYLGEFGIPVAQVAVPALSAALIAWLKTRPKRKTSLSFFSNGNVKKIDAEVTRTSDFDVHESPRGSAITAHEEEAREMNHLHADNWFPDPRRCCRGRRARANPLLGILRRANPQQTHAPRLRPGDG